MGEKLKTEGINSFQKCLSVWVFLCMVLEILVGKFLPAIPSFLDTLSVAEEFQSPLRF